MTKQKLIEVIRNIESELDLKASKIGIAEAFLEYAAEDAVLHRKDQVFKGKKAINKVFHTKPLSPRQFS